MPRALKPTKTAAKKAGPPLTYDWTTLLPQILDGIAAGPSLRSVCTKLKLSHTTVLHAIVRDNPPGIADQYARALQCQTRSMADDIRDEVSAPYSLTDRGNVDNGAVSARKLKVDTMKWLMSKLNKRDFGDAVDVTSGGEKLAPVAMLPPELMLPNENGHRSETG